MNIEDEKKAFQVAIPGELNNVDHMINTTRIGALGVLEDAFFEVWLAAKAHAEEMAKPMCILDKFEGLYRIRFSWHPNSFMKFRLEDEARAWAKDEGFRVVRE